MAKVEADTNMDIFRWPQWTHHAAALVALISLVEMVTARDALGLDISEAYEDKLDGVGELGRIGHGCRLFRLTGEEEEKEGECEGSNDNQRWQQLDIDGYVVQVRSQMDCVPA